MNFQDLKFKFKWFSIQKSQTLIHDWTKEEDNFLIKIIELKRKNYLIFNNI